MRVAGAMMEHPEAAVKNFVAAYYRIAKD